MKNYGEINVSNVGESCRVYIFEMPDGRAEFATEHNHFLGAQPKGCIEIEGLYPYPGTQRDAHRIAYSLAMEKMVGDGILVHDKNLDIFRF